MDGLKQLHPHQAAKMSRAEALRTLATAEGVSAADKRLAEIMLAGPEITPEDEKRLGGMWLRRSKLSRAVR